MSEQTLCSRCGEPADGWPADGDGELCQNCWEAYCDATWWEEVRRVEAYVETIGLTRIELEQQSTLARAFGKDGEA